MFPISPRGYEPHYGDLATLNTGGLILRSLGPELLKSVVADALDVLDTAVAVYEANGDYASGHAVSCWCRLMDQASRGLCETDDNREAMQCGKWHCHEQCWGVARDSMSAGTPIDRPCAGGIRSFAVPILADKEMIGSISVGHGTPPADPPTQRQLADRFHVDLDVLRREARAYEPRTGRDIALAKSRIVTAAQLIGALIEKTRRVREGQTVIDRVQTQLRSMVAERARAESGRTEEQQKLQTILDSTADGIVTIDDRGAIDTFNAAAQTMFGYTAGEVSGRNVSILMPAPHDREHDDHLLRYHRTGEPHILNTEREMEGRRKDGSTFPMSLRVQEVRTAATRTYIGTVQDLTVRKKAERQLRQTEAQLQQAQKMEAIGRLAGGIAHDFNNLLTVIQGRAAIQLRRLHLDDPSRSDAEAINRAVEQGAAVAKQLLTIGRKRQVQPQFHDLNEVVRDMTDVVGRLFGEDTSVLIDPCPELGAVLVDRGQIEQVLLNLAVNAHDAMPTGGLFAIRTVNHEATEDGQATGIEHGPFVRVSVSDTGIGMNEDTLSHIFEPFFTTKEEDRGTGLGLAMAYAIINGSGGRITVDSEVGRGTTVHIDLPRQRRHDIETPAPTPAPPTLPRPGRTTILLVEDHAELRAVMRETLTNHGHRVLDADSAAAAIEQATRHADTIDLLVTDVVLPGEHGPQLARDLSGARPEMRVLFVSGYAADGIPGRGVAPGRDHMLSKPFSPDELLHKVQDALEHPPWSASIQRPERSLSIDADKKLIVLRVRGTLHPGDIAQILEEYAGHPLYDPSFDGIVDARHLDSRVSPDDLKAAMTEVLSKGDPPTGRRALIVDSPRETALALLYSQLATSCPARVFSTEDAAYEWLGHTK